MNTDRVKIEILKRVSNPIIVKFNLMNYLNDENVDLFISQQKNKKYAIIDPVTNKIINFGDIRYQDYTYHQDNTRRQAYLKRSSNIRGNWKENKFSANNLSRYLLWNA